jgi:hypothetical protein
MLNSLPCSAHALDIVRSASHSANDLLKVYISFVKIVRVWEAELPSSEGFKSSILLVRPHDVDKKSRLNSSVTAGNH